ncbi:hypothetical protein BY458DRAFT_510624 [Sporodiniella umbellata]|nr:hypothetical protein BY458DRAFT_510624 [Sporodiniella umbellata]
MHDNSISKKHVTFTVGSYSVSKLEDISFKPSVNLIAHKTTYGTRLNGDLIKGQVPLLQDSVIQLGSLGFYMRLRWKNVVVCRNAAKSFEKKKLAKAAIRSGFSIVKTWDERCTHLYMTDLIVSDRLIYALINNKPIVSDKWLDKLAEKGDIDEADRGIEPVILENYGPLKKRVELIYNPGREELFEGIEFWIYSKEQGIRLDFLIALCQGSMKLLNLNEDIDLTSLNETTLIIQPPEEMLTSDRWIALEMQFCSNHGFVRSIQEHELIYSILYCSTNTLCNPKTPYPFETTNCTKPTSIDKLRPNQNITENPPSKSAHRAACSYPLDDKHHIKTTYQPSCSLSNSDTATFSPQSSFTEASEADTIMFNPSNTDYPNKGECQESGEICKSLNSKELDSCDKASIEAIPNESKSLGSCNIASSLIPSVNQFFDDFLGVLDSPPVENYLSNVENDSKPLKTSTTEQTKPHELSSLSNQDNSNYNSLSPQGDIYTPDTTDEQNTTTIQGKVLSDNQDSLNARSPEPAFHDIFDMGSPIANLDQEPEPKVDSPQLKPREDSEVQAKRRHSPESNTTKTALADSIREPHPVSRNTDPKSRELNGNPPSQQVVYKPLVKRPYTNMSEVASLPTGVNYKRFQKTKQLQGYASSDTIHISCPLEPKNNRRVRNYRLTTDEVDKDIAIRTNLGR